MLLVLTICLLSSGAECRDEPLTLSVEAMTPHQCWIAAPPAMAAWSTEHPRFRIVSWRCVEPRRRAIGI